MEILKLFPEPLVYMKMPSYYDLTDACQSDISKLSKLLGKQKDIMAKEELIIKDKEDTYLFTRAKNTLENSERKLKELETKYEYELQNLKNKYESDVSKLNDLIKSKEEIIEQETSDKKTKTFKNAEAEAAILQGKIDAIKENPNNYRNGPQTQVPKNSVSSAESEDVSFKEMMEMDRELPKLTFITPSYQYQSERQSKLNGSSREDMPLYGHKIDTTIYGPVSTLPPRPKIPIKTVPKRVINASTNIYPDEVSE